MEMKRMTVSIIKTRVLEAEIIRFNNNEEKWCFIGLKDNKPYEIFTGIVDDEMFPIPKSIIKGKITKNRDEHGKSRYDFQYTDKYGYNNTLGGLSHMFNKEYWNYAKLFSSVLRHGMPIANVVNLVASLQLDSDTINTWKNGVERALKRYIPNDTKAKKGKITECGSESLIYREGCLNVPHADHLNVDDPVGVIKKPAKQLRLFYTSNSLLSLPTNLLSLLPRMLSAIPPERCPVRLRNQEISWNTWHVRLSAN
jgi:hypothetical protein